MTPESVLGWQTVIPFAVMLLSIAILPLIPATAEWWERNRNKLLVALVLGIPVAAYIWSLDGGVPVADALVEYAQFIILLLALFVISGGIHLAGDIVARPGVNTIFLAIGATIASFIGTTGAAMLLIRPLLRTNAQRKFRVHTVVFFIFTVANSGGLLTPLGDPPLFLGMLRGVPFTWTFHLVPEWAFVNGMLLLVYFALDRIVYSREPEKLLAKDRAEVAPLAILGKRHILFLGMVVASVAFLPSVDMHAITDGTATTMQYIPWREIAMLSAMGLSLAVGPHEVRYTRNSFTWGPILEVAALFIGIFLTMIPALRVLSQVAPKLPLNDITFFLFTGGLSSVLDNAPTYVTFFEMARTLGETMPDGTVLVAGVPESYLIAISLGAVFCGALTYIGNGPNFMVKAVAEEYGVEMPSFGGYMVWAVRYLTPTLTAMVLIFIAEAPWTLWAGIGLSIVLIAVAVINMIRTSPKRMAELDAHKEAQA